MFLEVWRGRVLKLFHRSFPRVNAERHYRVTRAVHAAGLPAHAANEFIDVEDRCGIVFERVDGVSLIDIVRARPRTLFCAVRQLAELHASIHRREAPPELPLQREWIAGGIDAAPDVPASKRQAAKAALADLPNGMVVCHGDIHPANVLLTPRGPVVINWDTATRGRPVGNIACTSHLLRIARLPLRSPRAVHLLLMCTRALLHSAYMRHSLALHGATPVQGRSLGGADQGGEGLEGGRVTTRRG
jgi:aminoglycoside phosphotransferase (APT) family kinase protein